MGRWSYSDRMTADESKRLDINLLNRQGYLRGGYYNISWTCRGEKAGNIGIEISPSETDKNIRLTYTITNRDTGAKKDFDYRVNLTTTPCYFGGKRHWFSCPLTTKGIYCGKRVGTLYLPPSGNYFGCRHCYNLTYQSRNETSTYRQYPYKELLLYKKIDDIRRRMRKTTYKGRPTRKQMMILRLEAKIATPYIDLDEILYKTKSKLVT